MATRTLNDISQADFDNSKLLYKELLSTGNPLLDLGDGTALSDAVVTPVSQGAAYMNLVTEDLRKQLSFKLMQENPELITEEAMDNLASNYNIVRRQGQVASGAALLRLNSGQEYTIASGYGLTANGLLYVTTQDWQLKTSADDLDIATQIQIRQDSVGGYYVIVPMSAAAAGSAYNLEETAALERYSGGAFNALSAYVYEPFAGGTDNETNAEFMSRIPMAMSHSEFSSLDSIATRLMNSFSLLQKVSVTGMGDTAMLRDKHNIFGYGTGGKVDIYVKTFKQPYTRVFLVDAAYVADGTYSFSIYSSEPAAESGYIVIPGLYAIRAISSPDALLTLETEVDVPPIGSQPFTEVRSPDMPVATFHEFSSETDRGMVETAYSMWQKSVVTVTDVPAAPFGYPSTMTFKVEAYMAEDFTEIQAMVDDTSVRSKESDAVVRSALLAFVTVNVGVTAKPAAQLDRTAMVQAVADYINAKNFGEDLSQSQITSLLHQFDIVNVYGLTMEARVRGADGVWRTIYADPLSVADFADPSALIAPETVLFVADPRHIFITGAD